jgi:hypothetical protein
VRLKGPIKSMGPFIEFVGVFIELIGGFIEFFDRFMDVGLELLIQVISWGFFVLMIVAPPF